MTKYKQGFFKPTNPSKYKGDPEKIIYRSWWEFKVMSRFDLDQNVIWWQSEEIIIPYYLDTDRKIHRYYPDLCCMIRDSNGKDKICLIEIKPKEHTVPPKPSKNMTKKRHDRYITETMTYIKNQCKWKAARVYCEKNGLEFVIMTQDDINM